MAKIPWGYKIIHHGSPTSRDYHISFEKLMDNPVPSGWWEITGPSGDKVKCAQCGLILPALAVDASGKPFSRNFCPACGMKARRGRDEK